MPVRQRRDPTLQRFLLEGERVVVDVRQHWAVILLPLLYTLAGLVFVMWVDHTIRIDGGFIARALWVLWFGLAGWAGFQVAQWRHDRFLATNRRLLLDYGLFTTKVAMMPLIKVTDMSYQRTVPGRLLGYGRFILESAGQDQALRRIDWVPHPDEIYRNICREIFGVPADQVVVDADRDEGYQDYPGYPDEDLDARRPVVSPLGGAPAVPSAVEEQSSHSRAIPLHRRATSSPTPSGEVIYSSDEARLRRQQADTGPIPLSRPRHEPRPVEEDD